MKALVTLGLCSVLASFPVLADCIAPQMTPLPNGATASQEEMLAAQKAVKTYQAAVQSYLNCAAKTGVNDVSQDKVLGTLRDIADQFNKELRTYKAKQGA